MKEGRVRRARRVCTRGRPAPGGAVFNVRLQHYLLKPFPELKVLHLGRDGQCPGDVPDPCVVLERYLNCTPFSAMSIHRRHELTRLCRNTPAILLGVCPKKSGSTLTDIAHD
jgi:hypothetical protein